MEKKWVLPDFPWEEVFLLIYDYLRDGDNNLIGFIRRKKNKKGGGGLVNL